MVPKPSQHLMSNVMIISARDVLGRGRIKYKITGLTKCQWMPVIVMLSVYSHTRSVIVEPSIH